MRDKDVTDRIVIEQALEVFRKKVRNELESDPNT